MTKYPSWEDVCVPSELVYSIKTLQGPSPLLDSLIFQLVSRNIRRPNFTYHCGNCGYAWRPERTSEEVTYCLNCSSKKLHSSASLRFNKEVPRYSARNNLSVVLSNFENSYIRYFKIAPEKLVDCGWTDFPNVYCQAAGGEMITDRSPRLCILKSLICCPFLWDFSFDWNEFPNFAIMGVDHIGPILSNLTRTRER
jgi:hypothetical protein